MFRGNIRLYASAVATLLTVYASSRFIEEVQPALRWAMYFVIFVPLFLLFDNIALTIQAKRYTRFVDSLHNHITPLRTALNEANQIDDIDITQITHACRYTCIKLTEAFVHITGSRSCATCIKIMAPSGQNSVRTFYRTPASYEKRKITDSVEYVIAENTAFNVIHTHYPYRESIPYFLDNSLPLNRHYKNTSIEIYSKLQGRGIQTLKSALAAWSIWRLVAWPLPYKSTIVVPICPYMPGKRKKEDLIGFLCIDSPTSRTFKEPEDVVLMVSLVDSLFLLLKRGMSLIGKDMDNRRR
jgi:hypothetical protein